ncbi:CBO0543 family protein [Brevibacillus dissolubilis]|uniref:CBO0543 family protein n=1 Tax=Brevibacillus dissolubilis TaxID=1844116 RepID=UPI00159BB2EC|nr:CBO0543 family protein [Brevibacillus dissolubilis]
MSVVGSFFIVRLDWRRYGLLYLITVISGNIICYLFVKVGFYGFDPQYIPDKSIMPFSAIATLLPFYVLVGVRYSPAHWG